jgi:predicted MFS family arabinose efflux permease
MHTDSRRALVGAALALALGAAVSLGLARFSYALLLPPMRAELGWSYAVAGAMNTFNAAGYLAGAAITPALLRHLDARRVLLAGSFAAAALLALHAAVRTDAALYAVRALTGTASALVFVTGGVLAARLGTRAGPASGVSPGLVLGLYYGGTGLGIVASALLLPPLAHTAPAGSAGGWPLGWIGLGALAALAAAAMARTVAPAPPVASPATARDRAAWRGLGFALAGYFMFGVGYIGYMTFIVTLLREQQMSTPAIAAFYALLGAAVMASPWLWAGLLQRQRGGGALARLNALLAVATALPVLLPGAAAAFASGALFGGVFLSVVASTTALVRHQLPQARWPAGIGAFTAVFAAGQILGPALTGWLSDTAGGLRLGLAVSAAALALGAALAALQQPRG